MKPIFYPTDDNRVALAQDFEVKKLFVIPAGEKSNGANIPRSLWWLIPPFKPKYLPAVIVHDYLCRLEKYEVADVFFEELLLEIEQRVNNTILKLESTDSFIKSVKKLFESGWQWCEIRLMITAVRLYHKIRYGVKV